MASGRVLRSASRASCSGSSNATFKFINAKKEPLHFIICSKNDKKLKELTKFVDDNGGKVDASLNLFGPHTIVLVDDDETEWEHTGDVFKFSYINDCRKSNTLLDVSKFLKQESQDFVKGFEYMKIFYAQTYGWHTVPAEYSLRENHFSFSSTPGNARTGTEQESSDSSGVVSSTSDSRPPPKKPEPPKKRLCRRGGNSYTLQEDVAILRYIITHRLYLNLTGIVIWKNMEQDQVCPIRTWCSMRDHTTKILTKHLDEFDFLTIQQKELIRFHSIRKK